MYLIDQNGVIRHKFTGSPGGETLDKLIDQLLEKADTSASDT